MSRSMSRERNPDRKEPSKNRETFPPFQLLVKDPRRRSLLQEEDLPASTTRESYYKPVGAGVQRRADGRTVGLWEHAVLGH